MYAIPGSDRHDLRFQGTPHEVPLLLGPATEAFRNAAAQVANDYQRAMILWSIPKEPIPSVDSTRAPPKKRKSGLYVGEVKMAMLVFFDCRSG